MQLYTTSTPCHSCAHKCIHLRTRRNSRNHSNILSSCSTLILIVIQPTTVAIAHNTGHNIPHWKHQKPRRRNSALPIRLRGWPSNRDQITRNSSPRPNTAQRECHTNPRSPRDGKRASHPRERHHPDCVRYSLCPRNNMRHGQNPLALAPAKNTKYPRYPTLRTSTPSTL